MLVDSANSNLKSLCLYNFKVDVNYDAVMKALMHFKGKKMRKLHLNFRLPALDQTTLVAKELISKFVKEHLNTDTFLI